MSLIASTLTLAERVPVHLPEAPRRSAGGLGYCALAAPLPGRSRRARGGRGRGRREPPPSGCAPVVAAARTGVRQRFETVIDMPPGGGKVITTNSASLAWNASDSSAFAVDAKLPGRCAESIAAPKCCWASAQSGLEDAQSCPTRNVLKSTLPKGARYTAASSGKVTGSVQPGNQKAACASGFATVA